MVGSNVGAGLSNLMTTVLASEASTLVKCVQRPPLSAAGNCLSRLNVKATSLASNAWPSDHLTPWRMVKVRVRLSELNWWLVESIGVSWPVTPLT